MTLQGRQQQVVVTRPAGQQQRLMALLTEAGYQPLHQPALTIEPVPVDGAMQRTLMELDRYHAVFFASVNAARLALSAMADLWPQWPVGVHWLAVGRATAAELASWHLPATVPELQFRSSAGAALPATAARKTGPDLSGRQRPRIVGAKPGSAWCPCRCTGLLSAPWDQRHHPFDAN